MDLADREAEKYRKVYELDAYAAGPGIFHAPKAVDQMGLKSGDSLIDYGCGNGKALLMLQDLGIDVMGTDIIETMVPDYKHYIPFKKSAMWEIDESFPVSDYAFSSNVLEHIPTEKVDDTLRVIEQHTSKAAYLNIFQLPDVLGQQIGEVLHLTVESKEWWRDKLSKHFTVVREETRMTNAGDKEKETTFVCIPRIKKESTPIPKVTKPKSNESVIIVGHGPSVAESGHGEAIDSFDNVVRFTWRRGQPPVDYGTKIDYIVTSLRNHCDILIDQIKPNKGIWLFGRPGQVDFEMAKFLMGQRFKGWEDLLGLGREVRPWHYVYRDLGATGYIDPRQGAPGLIPSFSQGTGAIVMACERINPKKISLVGFDNVWAGKREDYTDWTSIQRGVAPRTSGHDLRVERILIDKLMDHYNVEIGPLNEKTKNTVL